ncbi:hypothetical protein CNECB9_1810002 [Cupriavidus necator]|uniref:Uncharacterized protein n=1 Tax=Cupriavidus necator TaxID=106590 RepID=A0A1K0IB48_CUPNE|nr:hypothetical protein CNECB9_1810002 [Cupriavidus necator]
MPAMPARTVNRNALKRVAYSYCIQKHYRPAAAKPEIRLGIFPMRCVGPTLASILSHRCVH